MPGPEVAVAPEAAYLSLGLSLLLTYTVLMGLRAGWQHSIGVLLVRLAGLISGIRIVGGSLSSTILRVNHFVLDAMDGWIELNETAVSKWWHGQMWIIHQLGDALAAFGVDVHRAIASLVTVTIPSTAGAIAKPLRGDLSAFKKAVRSLLNEELQRYARGIDALGRDLTREKLSREVGIDALAGTIKARIDALADELRGDIAAVNRYAHGALSRRLGRLERMLAEGVIGGVALYALTRAFPYWQCTNVRALNRAVCRAPIGALDDLLGLALMVVGPISIVEFARELQGITGFAADAVDAWVIED